MMLADKVWLAVCGWVCLKGVDEIRIQQTGKYSSILLGSNHPGSSDNEPVGFFKLIFCRKCDPWLYWFNKTQFSMLDNVNAEETKIKAAKFEAD